MSNIIEELFIKYNDELNGYSYCEYNDINNIPIGNNIKYISKNTFIKKNGYLKEINDLSLLKLKNKFNKEWYIYTNKYYIFHKKISNNKFKNMLQNLIDSNFDSIKIIKF